MPAAQTIAPDGTILRPRKGRPPKGGYPYPYPTSTDPARTIYIGKNNARHWADLKQRLGYNGDVDFVSFLLRLAEERLRYTRSIPLIFSNNNKKIKPCVSLIYSIVTYNTVAIHL